MKLVVTDLFLQQEKKRGEGGGFLQNHPPSGKKGKGGRDVFWGGAINYQQ